jgi:acyl-CoA synthetase (AMP-forming)/AMP-acid ligase II
VCSSDLGQIGEIRIRGEFVMTGYWENDDATRAAFTETGWLRTGDLAFRRPDGLITLVGRRGDMFKSGGYNVYPVEVEQVIERHPGVLAAAVVSVSDPLYSEVGAAFVISNSTELDEASLRQHSRGLLANYKIPKYFTFVSQMPMLPNGKVDKRALQSQHYLQNAGAI